jgi:hypothetical protein
MVAAASFWGPGYLESLACKCLENIARAPTLSSLLSDAKAFAYHHEKPYVWGSGCSGTDSPSWGFAALKSAFDRIAGASFEFEHLFSAECQDWKREFIKFVAKPRRLVSNIFSLSLARPLAVLDLMGGGKFEPAVEFNDIDFFIAGFVCKTVSGLSANKVRASGAVFDSSTATGSTLLAVLLFLERRRPNCGVLENVHGLKTNDQHLAVVAMLEKVGYVVVWRECSPFGFGFPQDRPRIYFLLFRADLVALAGLTRLDIEHLVLEIYDCVSAEHPRLSVDDVLVPEDHPYIFAMKEKARSDYKARLAKLKKPDTIHKWVSKHRATSSVCRASHWRDELAEDFPGFLLLPNRCQDLLDCRGVQFPSEEKLMLNVSQSKLTCALDHVGTVTPKAMIWAAHRGRLCYGRDAMALQAIWISDSQYSALSNVVTDNQLFDLAGNAFCAVDCVVVQLVAVLVASRLGSLARAASEDAQSDLDFDWGHVLSSMSAPSKKQRSF